MISMYEDVYDFSSVKILNLTPSHYASFINMETSVSKVVSNTCEPESAEGWAQNPDQALPLIQDPVIVFGLQVSSGEAPSLRFDLGFFTEPLLSPLRKHMDLLFNQPCNESRHPQPPAN